ncbi:MAG TPA: YdcF family protein [Stellaceae bacterium]
MRWRPRHGWLLPAGLVAIAWLGGLAWFISQVPTAIPSQDGITDAIVVLTGGSQRVENGLTLLAEGKARKLFVSGVYRGTDVKALLGTSHQQPRWLACCIELGYEADNTHGNAAETAAWMRAEHFHSLRLVTASYHMPRSLLEFSRAMPDIRILPNPVFPPGARRAWWRSPHAMTLIVAEYLKYLFALTGLQSLALAT